MMMLAMAGLAGLLLSLAPATSLHASMDDPPPTIPVATVGAPISLRQSSGSFIESSPGVKQGELLTCIRVRIPAISRLRNIHNYAHSFRVKFEAEQYTSKNAPKVDVCFHRNESLEAGQCAKENWESLGKRSWNRLMSPFETRLLDIRIRDSFSDVSLTVTVDNEFWPVRLFLLGLGLVLLLVAPIVSSWVPFYYSSGIALGVLLVVLVLMFQGMKLLPTGRKSTLYMVLYGSVAGMGTVMLHYFTRMLSSLLKDIGIDDEARNPVVMFLLIGVILTGAWLGCWGVKKFVLSEDGTVDIGTAQFVKWTIRILGSAMIMQSSHDPVMAVSALLTGVTVIWTIRKVEMSALKRLPLWKNKMITDSYNFPNAEFLSKDDAKLLRSPTDSIYKSSMTYGTSQGISANNIVDEEYYSSFHKTPTKKPMNRAQWSAVTQYFTKKGMQDLTSSSDFADWLTKNAHRITMKPHKHRETIQETSYMSQVNVDNKKRRLWNFGLFIAV